MCERLVASFRWERGREAVAANTGFAWCFDEVVIYLPAFVSNRGKEINRLSTT